MKSALLYGALMMLGGILQPGEVNAQDGEDMLHQWTLAQTAWGEARGDGVIGMLAVMNVVLNRVEDDRWPDSVHEVCVQPWQFSAWNDNDPNLQKMREAAPADPMFGAALEMARALLAEGRKFDLTHGATHYHATSMRRPAWAKDMTVTAVIGGHVFYR